MKIAHKNFKRFLSETIEKRLKQLEQEQTQLKSLLSHLDHIENTEAATKWMETIKERSKDIVTSKQIVEEQGVHRNYVAKITVDVTRNENLKKEVNLLPGLALTSMNIYFRDVYDLWKRIREEDQYPEGGELERERILRELPENERQFLK